MKNPFKMIAKRLVVAEANRMYRKAIKLADKRHEEEKNRIYVIEHPEDPKRLLLINKDEFLYIRHKLGITSKQQPLRMLKARAWYYTRNESERDPIPAKDLVIRRLAFVRDRLSAANLLGQ